MQPEYISVSETARFLGVNDKTIRSWCDRGVLRHTKITVGSRIRYLIHRPALHEMLKQNEVVPDTKRSRGRPALLSTKL